MPARTLLATMAFLLIVSRGWPQPPAVLPPGPVAVMPPVPQPPMPIYPDGVVIPAPGPSTGVPTFGDQFLPPPGWFASVDIAVVAPRFDNGLRGTLTFANGSRQTLMVPGAELDITCSPKIEIGYRFPMDLGSVILGYRSLVSEGGQNVWNNRGDNGLVTSRLNLNQVDLDYRSMNFDVGGGWDLFWRLGNRFAAVYYDSKANIMLNVPGPNIGKEARVSSNFLGAGPKAALEASRYILPGLAVFANVETAVLFGGIDQDYEQYLTVPRTGRPPLTFGASANDSGFQVVPMLATQIGLSWMPQGPEGARLSVGYQYEYWWNLGRLGASTGDLESQGLFFRGEIRF